MAKNSVYIYGFLPNYTNQDALSGSDVRWLEIFSRIYKKINLSAIGTALFSSYLKKYKINPSKIIEIKTNFYYSNQVSLTFFSLLIYLKYIPTQVATKFTPNTIHYSPADLIWNILPCFTAKIFHKKQIWLQCIHHLYPNWYSRKGNKLINFSGYYLQQFSLFLIKHYADAIIVVNPQIIDSLVQYGFDKKKIYLGKNGFNLCKPKKSKKNIEAIFVGRLSPSKGISRLINIWSHVAKARPNFRLYLVGNHLSKEFKVYKSAVKLRKLEKNIIFTGFVSEIKKNRLLSQSKIFVSMSEEEGFGISILEAIANYLPIYLNYLPVYSSIFGGLANYFTNQTDIQIAKDLISGIEKPIISKKKYKKMLKPYSWDKIAAAELKFMKYLKQK